jgi:hypothetical protein
MMGHPCRTNRAQRFTNRRHAAYPALTYRFSIHSHETSTPMISAANSSTRTRPAVCQLLAWRRRGDEKATWGAARPSARRRRADASDSKVDRHRHDLQKAAQTRPSDRRDVTHIRLGSGADPMNTRLESSLWVAPHRPRLPVRTATRSWNCNPDAHRDGPTARPPSMPQRSGGCAASATPTTRSERRWPTSALN